MLTGCVEFILSTFTAYREAAAAEAAAAGFVEIQSWSAVCVAHVYISYQHTRIFQQLNMKFCILTDFVIQSARINDL